MRLYVAALSSLLSLPALAQPTFTLIQPDAGYDYAVAQDVAKGSPLVLVSLQNATPRDPLRGYILNLATGVRTPLTDPFGSDLNPIAISADGSVVAGSLGGGPLVDQVAFVWDSFLGVRNIGGLPAGNLSYATGVSADGSVVVGTSGANFGDPYQQGWRWTDAGGFEPLTDLGADILIFGSAEDISADGQTVVGTGSIGDFDPDTDDIAYAAAWFGGGTTPTDLGNLPSPIITGGTLPTAASDDGSVIVGFGPGFAPNGSFANRGFRWTAATGLVDVGSLPSRPNASIYISDCSSDGNTLVGYSIVGGVDTWEAIIVTPAEGVRTLREVLAEGGVVVPASIALRETYCNADASIIAGWAYDIPSRRYRAYIATLGVGGDCPADFNADGFLDFFDYADFVEAFEAGDTRADFNRDGFLDFFDYADFVEAFEAGC
jgi:hypothetical protein